MIHGPPEVMPVTIDREKHLVEVPLVAWSRAPATQLIRILLPKLPAPFVDRFVRDDHAAGEQQLFNITVAQTEPVIQPHAVADDFGRKAVVLVAIGWCWCLHTVSMSHREEPQQVDSAADRHRGRFSCADSPFDVGRIAWLWVAWRVLHVVFLRIGYCEEITGCDLAHPGHPPDVRAMHRPTS